MTKKISLLILIIFTQIGFAQNDYFAGKETVCPLPENSKKLYDLGLETIRKNLYLGSGNQIFRDLIKKDSTFCDAWFLAGYTYRLSNMYKEATVYYYMADSLSNNKSLMFKQNLATTSAYAGNFELARDKYTEIIKYFPKSPEGYYGISSTAIYLEDFENGLKNMEIAISKYRSNDEQIGNEVFLTKALLLTRSEKFEESLSVFEEISGRLKRDDNYLVHYAYSLKKVGQKRNDKKLIKQADKLYRKIKDKTVLSDEMKAEFNG